jgi:hypothetical protein
MMSWNVGILQISFQHFVCDKFTYFFLSILTFLFFGSVHTVGPPFTYYTSLFLDNEIGAVCKTRTCLGEEWNHEINSCSAELFTIRGVGKSCGSPIKQYDAVVLSTNERTGVVAKGKSEHIVSGSSLPSLNYTFYWKIHVDLELN